MKLLIVFCFLGLAAASFRQEAESAIDDSVMAFLEGSMEHGSLQEALGLPDAFLDEAEDDIKSELGRIFRDVLNRLVERITASIEQGKDVSQYILEKVKDLKEKVGGNVKELAHKVLKELLEKIKPGQPNLDDQMDAVARMKFSDIVQEIKEKIISEENIQKLRDYISNLPEDKPVVKVLKDLLGRLSDNELKEVLRQVLEYKTGIKKRALKEPWEKMKEFLKDSDIELLKGLGSWIANVWNKALDKAKDKQTFIRALALEIISHAKDMNVETTREALEFLLRHKDDLGAFWKQIVEAVKSAIGKF